MFLFVQMSGLYLAGIAQRHSDCTRALVAWRGDRVVECDAKALARQVQPGTLISEAKAILREDGRAVEIIEHEFLEARNQWLDVCLAYTNRIEAVTSASAFLDFSLHPQPYEVAEELAVALSEKFPYSVHLGMAPSKWVAELAALPMPLPLPPNGLPWFIPISEPAAFLADLPTQVLKPLPTKVIETLIKLGYRRVRDVAKAPLGVLTGQFGPMGIVVQQAVKGAASESLNPNYPDLMISQTLRPAGVLHDFESLKKAAGQVAQELAFELSAQDRSAQEILFTLEHEEHPRWHFRRPLPKPVQTATALRTVLHYALDQAQLKGELPGGVTAVSVALTGLKVAPRVQRTFQGRHNPVERAQSAENALRQVKSIHGVESVVKAHELHVPRRIALLRLWRQTTGWTS